MCSYNKVHRKYRSLFLIIGFILSTPDFAEHGGAWGMGGSYHQGNGGAYYHQNGGYHQQDGYHQGMYNHYDGYHHDDGNDYNYYPGYSVGNYYPGNGWVAPEVTINPTVNTTVEDSDCQTIQQCNDNGTCILSQDCY